MSKKVALVVGATGIIGSYILEHISQLEDWDAIGIARTIPDQHPERYVSMDLLNEVDIQEKLREIPEVTHIFYAAYQNFPALSKELIEVNTSMLEHVVNAVEEKSGSLQRVILMQGAKVYGSHLGKFKTPAKESAPRHLPPNFYYNQEDFLRTHQKGKGWSWTILRPDVVAGLSIGNPMNLAMLIGDVFRWEHIWPKFAECFGMDTAPVQTISLSDMMPLQKETWDPMVQKYDLQPTPYEKVAAWPFGDLIWGSEYDVITDTTKIKQFGFHEVADSETVFLDLFAQFKNQKLIPSS
ncbi:NAD-dependent epimerase/dehydratase family protein [Paenibacillus terrae]|uniref:NAD-dependent epimerase/dehydratase family protein n=1 Tax=Paenibacillus terrae TaxID=159743 RepID=UPI0011EB9D40|nr:NAD-dependent epimerase/dehydratase family protein [Paenibacillus terrae]